MKTALAAFAVALVFGAILAPALGLAATGIGKIFYALVYAVPVALIATGFALIVTRRSMRLASATAAIVVCGIVWFGGGFSA